MKLILLLLKKTFIVEIKTYLKCEIVKCVLSLHRFDFVLLVQRSV